MALISADKYAHLHADLKGPGDARPTALQIVADNNMTGALKGKTILITGTSSGIGTATAEALATTGADLFLAVRNLPKAREALKQVLDEQGKDGRGRAELLEMDMDSLDSVRKAAQEFKNKSDNLTILVANAGIMAVPTLEHTKDGFEKQFGVNHLAHFLLFILLRPLLLASSTKEFNSRVVMLSSSGHRGGGIYPGDYGFENEEYSEFKSYGQSKTANIYMANEIERRYGARGLHANSLMPGGIETGLQQYVPAEMRAKWFTNNPYVKSIEQGAATTVLAAIGKDWEGVGGKYLEDCQESFAQKDPGNPTSQGYAKHAFDKQLEGTLWKDSLILVGEKDEE
jgi:NAD(P)-dependent dehydrogenase (short-subunit alcohol dehydrogenase family)